MSEDRKSHWERVYETKKHTDVSWYQPVPEKSLQLIRATRVGATDAILDVGGGASTLVDNLLADGFEDVTILDISAQALRESRSRLGESAGSVSWIESDVTEFQPERRYDLWHDRAVFHFLIEAIDHERYIRIAKDALRAGGHLVLATFGPEGPLKCSGLEIRRYGIEQLQDLFGADFELRQYETQDHETPSRSMQQFLYSWWQLRS